MKHIRPSLEEVQKGMIIRFCPTAGRMHSFTPFEILQMHEFALAGILDLSDEGVQNIRKEARWLVRAEKRKDLSKRNVSTVQE